MFNAGSVEATLGGRFNGAAFNQFDQAMLGSGRKMRAFEEGATRSQSRVSAATAAMGRAAKVAAVGGVAALGVAIVDSVKKAADFEQQLSALGSVSGATARQMKALRREAMAAGAETKFSAMEAAVAQTELAKGGVSVANILKGGLKGALALAAAGEMELGDAAATTANALNLFKMRGDEATKVADAMAYAANATTADVSDFAIALQQGGAAAKSAGLDFNETMVLLEALADVSVKGSDAGTSMKTALVQLANPTAKQAEAAKRLGLSFFDAQGSMKPLPQIAADLDRAFTGLSDKQRLQAASTLAGTDGMRALLALYSATPEQLRKLAAGTAEQGTAADVAAKKQDNFKGKLEQLGGAIETAQIALGSELLPLLTRWVEQGTEAVSAWIDSGGAEQFGRGVSEALREVVDIAQDVIDVGGDVVEVITSIGNALGFSDIGTFAAIGAGILAWRAAASVAGGVLALATAVTRLGAASRALAAGQGASAALGALTGVGGAGGLAGAGAGAGAAAGTLGRLAAGLVRVAGPLAATLATAKLVNDAIINLTTGGKGDTSQIEGPVEATQLSLQDLKEGAVGAVNALDFVRDGFSDAGDQARNFQEWMDKATDASDGAHTSFLHVRDGVEQTGRAFAQSRLSLEQAKRALDATREGTEEHRQALLDYRSTLAENMRQERAWNDGKLAARSLARSQVEATRLQIDRLRELRAEQGLTSKQQYELEGLYQQLESRLNTQAALTANLARMHRGMAKATGEAEQALGRLARAGEGDLARTIALRYEAPKDAGRVAAQAARAIEAGVKPTIVTRVVADTANARAAVQAMRALIAGVPRDAVFKVIGQTKDARMQVAAFRALVAGMPPRAVVRILADGAIPERVKIAAFTAAARGVPPEAISKILANGALSARQQVDQLRGAIESLHDKSVTITTHQLTIVEQRFIRKLMAPPIDLSASGRRAGAARASLVGEGGNPREYVIDRRTGAGYVTDGPMLVGLGADDYVVPTESRYRGRALGLFVDLARDLGVEGYGGGRRPRASASGNKKKDKKDKDKPKKQRKVPAKIAEGGVPFENVKQRHEQADDALHRAHDAENTTRKDLKKAQKDLKAARSKDERKTAQQRVDELRRQLQRNAETVAERAKAAKQRRREFVAARKTDTKIKNLQTDINVARDAMEDADRVDDEAAFDRARSTRTAKLRRLIDLLQRALRLASPNTDYFRSLKEQLSQLGGTAAVEGRRDGFGGELGEVEAEEMDVDEAPEPPEPEPMTDAEKARLRRINADIALAALTTTLEDDKARAQELVDFLGTVLGEVQADPAGRGGDEAIADIAGQLKTAKDNLASFTSGVNDDPDLQAQIEQEREGRRVALESARISDAAVAAFRSAGDIGAGGADAYGAAANPNGQPQIVINTLHPADPATLDAIGSAATAGMSLQGLRRASRQKIGV